MSTVSEVQSVKKRPHFVIANRFDGLGGRLVNLLFAMTLADRYQARLLIHWSQNGALSGKSLHCLFTTPLTAPYGKTPQGGRIYWEQIAALDEIRTLLMVGHEDIPTQSEVERFDAIALRSNNIIALISMSGLDADQIQQQCRSIFMTLQPHPRVLALAARLPWGEATGEAMGIHVRRGDLLDNNKEVHRARAIDLDSYFLALEPYPNHPILLATDGSGVIDTFRNRYGRRVYVLPKPWWIGHSRQFCGDLRYALAEIVALSRCRAIVSGPSNFSRAAALIGDCDYKVLPTQKATPQWDTIKGNWGI